MQHTQVEVLLFDLGQVVIGIDFDQVFARWAAFAGCDAAAIRDRFSHDSFYKQHEVGAISDVAYFDSLRASLGIDLSDAQFLEGWNSIFVGEMPGIRELLPTLADKLPIYAFSNTNMAHEAHWSQHYVETVGNFEAIFVSSTIGLRKPDAEAFDHVVQEMGVPADKILFFDDAHENVRSAQEFGLQTVHVTTPDCVHKAIAALDL